MLSCKLVRWVKKHAPPWTSHLYPSSIINPYHSCHSNPLTLFNIEQHADTWFSIAVASEVIKTGKGIHFPLIIYLAYTWHIIVKISSISPILIACTMLFAHFGEKTQETTSNQPNETAWFCWVHPDYWCIFLEFHGISSSLMGETHEILEVLLILILFHRWICLDMIPTFSATFQGNLKHR